MSRKKELSVQEQIASLHDSMLLRWLKEGVPVTDKFGVPVLYPEDSANAGEPMMRPCTAKEAVIINQRLATLGIKAKDDLADGVREILEDERTKRWNGEDPKLKITNG